MDLPEHSQSGAIVGQPVRMLSHILRRGLSDFDRQPGRHAAEAAVRTRLHPGTIGPARIHIVSGIVITTSGVVAESALLAVSVCNASLYSTIYA